MPTHSWTILTLETLITRHTPKSIVEDLNQLITTRKLISDMTATVDECRTRRKVEVFLTQEQLEQILKILLEGSSKC